MIHDQDKPESDPDDSPPNDVQDAPGEPGGNAPAEVPYPPADPDERGVAD